MLLDIISKDGRIHHWEGKRIVKLGRDARREQGVIQGRKSMSWQ
jgi:hypothetical protein